MAALATPERTLSDLAAMRRYARKGDPRAFECLVKRYQQMVFATCMRTLRDTGDAEDAAQETFLKLARQGNMISSNVAAWLHASARRTSIDMLRSRLSNQKAIEQSINTTGVTDIETPDGQAALKELEVHLDLALEGLDEPDRSLIVQRYLAGRLQTDMAKEARVSPGTMTRRIDRAMVNLRANMPNLAIGGVGGGQLAGNIEFIAGTQSPSAELAPSIMKIGIAGAGTAPSGGGILGQLTWAGPLAIGLLTTGFVAIAIGFLGSNVEISGAVDRPTRTSPRFMLIDDQRDADAQGTMSSDGVDVRFEFPYNHRGSSVELRFTIDDANPNARKRVMLMTLTGCEVPTPDPRNGVYVSEDIQKLAERVGQTFRIEYQIIDDLILMGIPDLRITWRGQRQVGGDEPRSDAPDAAVAGLWHGISEWDFDLGEDNITIYQNPNYRLFRYRILDWSQQDGVTRIQTICADSVDPTLVGKRVKMILAEKEGVYTLALYENNSPKINEWPAGFDRENDPDLRIMTWREVKP